MTIRLMKNSRICIVLTLLLTMLLFPMMSMADDWVAPSNLQWIAPGFLQYEVPTNQIGRCYFQVYELKADGSWEKTALKSTGISDLAMKNAPKSEAGNAILKHSFTSTIAASGKNKTIMVQGKMSPVEDDNDFSSGAVSEYSPIYTYVVPQQKLTVPADIHWSTNKANTLVWTSDAGVDSVLIRLMIDGVQRRSIIDSKITAGTNEFDLSDFLNRAYQEYDPAVYHYSYELQSLSDQIETWAASDNVPFE